MSTIPEAEVAGSGVQGQPGLPEVPSQTKSHYIKTKHWVLSLTGFHLWTVCLLFAELVPGVRRTLSSSHRPCPPCLKLPLPSFPSYGFSYELRELRVSGIFLSSLCLLNQITSTAVWTLASRELQLRSSKLNFWYLEYHLVACGHSGNIC